MLASHSRRRNSVGALITLGRGAAASNSARVLNWRPLGGCVSVERFTWAMPINEADWSSDCQPLASLPVLAGG